MARILILLAIVLGIFWWLRGRAAREAADRPTARRRAAPNSGASGNADDSEPMVQCAQCGVHLPRGEAIAWHGLHYCRRSHLPDVPGQGGQGDSGARS
ncbi:uncharacterized protein SAMN05216345_11665 [Cupriavidus sp. YR651]|uniref:PP0621 family protein n=1 Tax=Cupriavidus sp. YR651 TaxID=1855315 RepID=UPI0008841CBA|nr:PP0621 family protein [Cupriavidus sp. YR651]SDD80170.1 uncharacterized protein SAMN05216345_11665 [Cupriavidus sp. YR651]